MTPPNRFMLHKEFDYVFFSKKMVLLVSYFWFSVTTVFSFITRYLFRYQIYDTSQKKNFTSSFDALPLEDVEEIPELEEDSEYDGFGEKETTPEFSFKFQFQSYEDSRRDSGEFSTSKCEFLSNKVFSGFTVEPEIVSFSVKELFLNSNEDYSDNKEIVNDGFLSERDSLLCNLDKEEVHDEIVISSYSIETSEKPDSVVLSEVSLSEKEELINSDSNSPEKEEFDDEGGFSSENELVSSDSEADSIILWDKYSVMVSRIDSNSEAISSDGDSDNGDEIEPAVELDKGMAESVEAFQNFEEIHLGSRGVSDQRGVEISKPTSSVQTPKGHDDSTDLEVLEMMEDIEKFEELHLQNFSILDTDAQIEKEFYAIQVECEQEDLGRKGAERNSFEDSEEASLEASSSLDFEESNGLGSFWSRGVSDQEGVKISKPTSPVQTPKGHDDSTDLEVLEMMDDIEKFEELHLQNSNILDTDAQIEKEFYEIQAECEQKDLGRKGAERDSFEDSEEASLKASSSLDFEESNGLESLWEHQDLIEQLKMEIRKVKATGLPTIFEESESPTPSMSEDLKPWKIDEKFIHKEQMNGLHKVYKSYRERMRKFDILNYQKMYAMGFLQLKDPLQSIMCQKASAPSFTTLLSQNFLLPKRRRPNEEDSSTKFLKEMEIDLEFVYVGQLCLSWDILHWQYGKARELLEDDPYEIRPYNQVAGEFQQFQVLVQRFLENETFQGPRVLNYIKSRCVLRNLLQVPMIKEDPKDKEARTRSKDAITCSMLLDIIEESMQIYWEFVRADKHDGNVILKSLIAPRVKVIEPEDTELLVDIQTNLQKKEKKIKELLRTGNCLVKRFQKQHKEQSDQLLFFSQVDLKLVSRVLKMPRITTDQLVWCQKKLNKISFVNRKLQVEPTFLLFPC